MDQDLPRFLQKVIQRYPEVWQSYENLGKEITSIGALDSKTQHLVKLSIAIGAGREGAVHSHTKRCVKAGIPNEQMFQTAMLAVTTIGWSGAMAALSWINDIVDDL
jgi:alkylhydroperoxidase/carboxymuconolactone decarboxylase family protein YurZ